jgi:hypothetical protein
LESTELFTLPYCLLTTSSHIPSTAKVKEEEILATKAIVESSITKLETTIKANIANVLPKHIFFLLKTTITRCLYHFATS